MGIAEAKKRGVRFGRPRCEMPPAFVESARLVAAGKLSTREGAHHCGMSYSTFREWLHEFESHEKVNCTTLMNLR